MLVDVRLTWKAWSLGMARRVRRWQSWAAGGLCLVGMVGCVPWRAGVVVGHSMEPTLPHGTPFLYDQSYYRTHPLRSGDVVVVRHRGEVWIKRVYAGQGARFWTLRYGGYELVRHDPIRATQEGYFARAASRLRSAHGVDYRTVRLRIPAGHVFLVGDGATSEDSRLFGPVDCAEILGRVVALPGQRLGSVPDWVELSSPERGYAVKASSRTETNSSALGSG